MLAKTPVPARLFVLLAREAPVGVILRRGPSKWVQLMHWDTEKDIFTPGQWFHGRIDGEGCDLSPNGKLLVYFAYKGGNWHKNPSYRESWTAISKPPYFTALALWPLGGSQGGGGYFRDNESLWLRSGEQTEFHPDHPPIGIKVIPNNQGLIESNHVEWKLIHQARNIYDAKDSEFSGDFRASLVREGWWLRFIPPRTWQKQIDSFKLIKQRLGYRTSRTFVDEYSLLETSTNSQFDLGRRQWADFDLQRCLVLAKAGKLFSASVINGELTYTELADFNAHTPELLEAPDWAKKW